MSFYMKANGQSVFIEIKGKTNKHCFNYYGEKIIEQINEGAFQNVVVKISEISSIDKVRAKGIFERIARITQTKRISLYLNNPAPVLTNLINEKDLKNHFDILFTEN